MADEGIERDHGRAEVGDAGTAMDPECKGGVHQPFSRRS
jgi:hypothetical protein